MKLLYHHETFIYSLRKPAYADDFKNMRETEELQAPGSDSSEAGGSSLAAMAFLYLCIWTSAMSTRTPSMIRTWRMLSIPLGTIITSTRVIAAPTRIVLRLSYTTGAAMSSGDLLLIWAFPFSCRYTTKRRNFASLLQGSSRMMMLATRMMSLQEYSSRPKLLASHWLSGVYIDEFKEVVY